MKLHRIFSFETFRRFVFVILFISTVMFMGAFGLFFKIAWDKESSRTGGDLPSEKIIGLNVLPASVTQEDSVLLETGQRVFFARRISDQTCMDVRKRKFVMAASADSIRRDTSSNATFRYRVISNQYPNNFIVADLQNDIRRPMFDQDMHIDSYCHFKTLSNRMILIEGQSIPDNAMGKSLYLYDSNLDSVKDITPCSVKQSDWRLTSFSLLGGSDNEYENGKDYKMDENIVLIRLLYSNRNSDNGENPEMTLIYDLEQNKLNKLN